MKYLTLLLIFTLTLAQPLAVFAASESPEITPSPIVEKTSTETPAPEPSPTPETIPSPTPEALISPAPTLVEQASPTSTQETEKMTVTPTKSTETLKEATPSSEFVEETPPLPTGTVTAPIIKTGDAENTIAVDNVVNTNVTGSDNCMLILSHNFDTQDIIDLTDSCEGLIVSTGPAIQGEIDNRNDAEVQTTIQALADTGKNILFIPNGKIQTGNSTVQVDLFNLINTNINGTNTFFGVINLFNTQEGDIILPYELDYLLKGESVSSNDETLTELIAEQTATVLTDIETIVTTGENAGADVIKTGNAVASIRLHDKVNTSLFGSNFLILEINNFGEWDGELFGWWGDVMNKDNQTVAVFNGHGSFDTGHHTIQNENTATVKNTVHVYANTGGNSALEAQEITTGNAEAKINIFDFVNTNITGNNWYHVVVNIFDSFKGNIIFPRPDLAVSTTADKSSIGKGDTVTFRTDYSNNGIFEARNTLLETGIPDNLKFLEASAGGIFSNGFVRWDLGTLNPLEIGSVWFRTQAKQSSHEPIPLKTTILTSTDEPEKKNNISNLSLIISSIASSPIENSSEEQNSVVNAYIRETKLVVPIDSSYINKQNVPPSGSVIIPQSRPETKNSVLGEKTTKPFKKAETFSPLIFMLIYMTGAGVILFKEWFEG